MAHRRLRPVRSLRQYLQGDRGRRQASPPDDPSPRAPRKADRLPAALQNRLGHSEGRSSTPPNLHHDRMAPAWPALELRHVDGPSFQHRTDQSRSPTGIPIIDLTDPVHRDQHPNTMSGPCWSGGAVAGSPARTRSDRSGSETNPGTTRGEDIMERREFLKAGVGLSASGVTAALARPLRASAASTAEATSWRAFEMTTRLGNIRAMLETGNLGGKCADLNALFVGLARAAGIPARDVYGVRVADSAEFKSLGRSGDITKAQHCRAECYLSSFGWVAVDPADVRKVVLEEKGGLPLTDPIVKTARARLFGAWEMNWLAFNYAADLKLPQSAGEPLAFFMYPQAETAGSRRDSLDPDSFRYRMTARELNV